MSVALCEDDDLAGGFHGGGVVVGPGGVVTTRRFTSGPSPPSAEEDEKQQDSSCKYWADTGTCPFESRCHFAWTHTPQNAGKNSCILLAGNPVCKHWAKEGSCPLKTCHWKGTHTPGNSPRYAKFLAQTPVPASGLPLPAGGAAEDMPRSAPASGVPAPAPAPAPAMPTGAPQPHMQGQVTVLKRRPPHRGGGGQGDRSRGAAQPQVTVMKRDPRAAPHNEYAAMRPSKDHGGGGGGNHHGSGGRHGGGRRGGGKGDGARSSALEIKDPRQQDQYGYQHRTPRGHYAHGQADRQRGYSDRGKGSDRGARSHSQSGQYTLLQPPESKPAADPRMQQGYHQGQRAQSRGGGHGGGRNGEPPRRGKGAKADGSTHKGKGGPGAMQEDVAGMMGF